MASNSANALAVQLQKISAHATIEAQKLANQATEKSFKYNKEEANTARTWQENMSNSAHQREVKDLIKAGLNPVLAANQGAQSYTTSSASAQANDASGAAATLAASQMSGMAQGYSADKSSAAARYAAKQQAAATRYAAEQSAAAMRASAAAQQYAADRAYAAQKYAWDKKQEMQKYEYINKPAGNAWSLADKYLSRAGISGSIVKGLKTILNGVSNKSLVSVYNSSNDFKLSKIGYTKMNQACSQLGIAQTKNNRYLVYKAINGNQSAINTLRYIYSPPGYKHRTKHQR